LQDFARAVSTEKEAAMSRSFFAVLTIDVLLLTGCGSAPSEAPVESQWALDPAFEAARPAGSVVENVRREPLGGDVFHYQVDLRVGPSANAVLRLHRVVRERAPWVARPSHDAVMLLHGDFATFASNFAPRVGSPASTAPGLSLFLAQRNIDVWGLDRRWTHAPADGADLSDFADMSFSSELDDIGRALGFARAVRVAGSSGNDRLTLVGFSRGGHLAYAYAAREGAAPRASRHVKALVPVDVFAEIAPGDEPARANACDNAAFERDALATGTVDSDNSFFVSIGRLALDAPSAPSPFFDGETNRQAFLDVVTHTSPFFTPAPHYHLLAGIFDGDAVTGLRETPETVGETWFAAAAPHQSMREVAESDALWCGAPPLPLQIDLSRIEIPLYYLGAAGGFAEHGIFTTTRVRSSDVTLHIVQRFGPERVAEDFGHGDLLFATDAPSLAWRPLADWVVRH
jgi:pimeloyl-ACP methyl ester carboxylesterase